MRTTDSYLIEKDPELPLRLSNPLAETVRSLPHEESHLPLLGRALGGEGAGQQGLARSRRAVEQHAP